MPAGYFIGWHTRSPGGPRYEYQVTYTDGDVATWTAGVYCDGVLVGNPTGNIQSNVLTGAPLQAAIAALVVESIDQRIGMFG